MRGLSLRPYQEQAVSDIRKALQQHVRAIFCAQTGSGKTLVSKYILGRCAQMAPSGCYGFFVQRRGLVDNASNAYAEEPVLDHGILMSGHGVDWSQPIQVGSIDTVNSWYLNDEGVYIGEKTFDVIIGDECHSHTSKLTKLADANQKRREELGLTPCLVLGLSATPAGSGIGWFNAIVNGPTVKFLQDEGYLSRYRYVAGSAKADMSKLVMRAGKYTDQSVAEAISGLAGNMIRDWKKFASDRQTISFFPRLAEAREAQELFQAAGVECSYLDGQTPDSERHRIFDDFTNRRTQVICNVGIVERGTDLPVTGCVQLCTCIGSLHRFRQIIGRGARPCEGVPDCIVLDHGSNIMEGGHVKHGFFEDPVDWLIEQGKARSEHKTRPTIECFKCGRMYRGGKCPDCDYEPLNIQKKQAGLNFSDSKMAEIVKQDAKPRTLDSHRLMVQKLYQAARYKGSRGKGGTVGQAIVWARVEAKKKGLGDMFSVPKVVRSADGREWKMPDYGSPDLKLPVKYIFPFTEPKK